MRRHASAASVGCPSGSGGSAPPPSTTNSTPYTSAARRTPPMFSGRLGRCSASAANCAAIVAAPRDSPGRRNRPLAETSIDCPTRYARAHRTVAVVPVSCVRPSGSCSFSGRHHPRDHRTQPLRGFGHHPVGPHGIAAFGIHRLRSTGASRVTVARASPPSLGRELSVDLRENRATEGGEGCRHQTTWRPGGGAASPAHQMTLSTDGVGTILDSYESRWR